jgi:mitochondrial fission protein ELM1
MNAPAAPSTPPHCWAISDGAAGNERQAVALAQALGLSPRVLRISVREPWQALAPRLAWGAGGAIRDADGQPLSPPWPALAIGCGRRAALATRLLRRWSDGRVFTVQVLDPRIATRDFDLVVAPRHDRVEGANVLHSIGALHGVDTAWLAAGRTRFAHLGTLPGPRTAVLVGARATRNGSTLPISTRCSTGWRRAMPPTAAASW